MLAFVQIYVLGFVVLSIAMVLAKIAMPQMPVWSTYARERMPRWCNAGLLIGTVLLIPLLGWTIVVPISLLFFAMFNTMFLLLNTIFPKKKHNSLDQQMQPYVGQQPPAWIKQIADRGWNGYSVTTDGKLSSQNLRNRVVAALEMVGSLGED